MAYSRSFFVDREEASLRSARAVLPFVLDIVKPCSIVDFGCGTGTWLHAAKGLGVQRVMGIEGDWARGARSLLQSEELCIRDLNGRVVLKERFDLAISLEVAEHLEPARALGFVEDLCAASRVVLFGAAIPGQGGTGHLNEQWQSYWAGLFSSLGYDCLDVVRPRFWTTSEVLPWYKQNAFLYVSAAARQEICDRVPTELTLTRLLKDVVHPDTYARLFTDPPLRVGMRISRAFVRRGLQRLIRLESVRKYWERAD
jgi:hypothetical protein